MEKTEALEKLAEMLEGREWVLVGGMARKLQGIEAETEDIDIAASREEAEKIDEILAPYAKRRLSHGETKKYASFFGVYELEGVKVELMAELVLKHEDCQFHLDVERMKEAGRAVELGGKTIMVEPMEESLLAKLVLGDIERAESLAKFLGEHGYDDRYFERVVREEKVPDYMAEEARKMLEL